MDSDGLSSSMSNVSVQLSALYLKKKSKLSLSVNYRIIWKRTVTTTDVWKKKSKLWNQNETNILREELNVAHKQLEKYKNINSAQLFAIHRLTECIGW